MKQLKPDGNKLLLCCGNKGCPSVEIIDDIVHIVDDDNNTVRLTVDQASIFNDALNQLIK